MNLKYENEIAFVNKVINSCTNPEHIASAKYWLENIAWKRFEPLDYEIILTSLELIELNMERSDAPEKRII